MTTHSFHGDRSGSRPAALNTQPNISEHDEFYHDLIDLHRDLSAQQSALVNAKLILLLANHIGDLAILRDAMRAARLGIDADADSQQS